MVQTDTLLSGLFKCLPKFRPRKQKPVEKASGTRERTPPPLTDVNDSLNDPLPTIYDPQPTPRDRAVGGDEVPTTAPPLEQETGFQVRALLDEKQLQQLWRWLPAREHTKDARIVYCTGTHGRSLQTLYRKARNEWGHRQGNSAVLPAPESLLIIKTTLKDVVGAYLTRWPRIPELHNIQARGSLYLGTGESFVFSFPQGADACKASWIPGRPTNFLCCSTQLLSVGDSALCVDQYVERVTSHASSTFGISKGLLAKGENDEVVVVASGENKDVQVVDSFAGGEERAYAVRDSSDFEIAELQLLRLI